MSCYKVIEDKFIKPKDKGEKNGVAGLDGYGYVKKENLPTCNTSTAAMLGYGVLLHSQFVAFNDATKRTNVLYPWLQAIQEMYADYVQRKYKGQNVCVFQIENYASNTIYFNGQTYAKELDENGVCVLDLGEKKTINNTTANERVFVKSIRKIIYLPDGITNYDDAFNAGSTNANNLEVLCDIDMSQCTSTLRMFFYQQGLKNLDVSKWDVSKMKNLNYAFAYTGLTTLDVSKWNVASLESCASFISSVPCEIFDTSNWVAPNLNPMSMFAGSKVSKLDISKLATTNVKSCHAMFYSWVNAWWPNISNRQKIIIGLENLDTSKCTDFGSMFSGCGNVTLNLSHFDMRAATNVDEMFGVDSAKNVFQDVTLGENFFDMPNISSFKLTNLSMSENLKQSLINCFDRKTAGQPTMTIQMPSRLNPGVTALNAAEKTAIEAKGYVVEYDS